jgi:hypothetical protein
MISIPERLAGQVPQEGDKKSFDNFSFILRCASPGIIQSFNEIDQTVTVKIAIAEKIKIDGEIVSRQIPVLVDVPICIPSAGGYHLTLPIKAGDECLVIFSDTCIDSWWERGCTNKDKEGNYIAQESMSLRRHDLSDAFAIVGIKSVPKAIPAYSTGSTQLRNEKGNHYVEIAEEAINIVFGATKIVVDDIGVTITGNVFMNNNLEVKENVLMDSNLEVVGETTLIGLTTIGDVNMTGVTTVNGKVFLDHQHAGVKSGTDNTQGVV